MPEELESLYVDRNLQRALELYPGSARKFPAAVDDTLTGVFPIWGTSSLENMLLASETTVGGGVFAFAQTPAVPEGKVHIPIAIEVSHTDPTDRNLWFSVKWSRAGVTTTVALTSSIPMAKNRAVAVEDLSRLYLGPTFQIHASITVLAVAETMTLKVAFLERNLGETFPA